MMKADSYQVSFWGRGVGVVIFSLYLYLCKSVGKKMHVCERFSESMELGLNYI